MPAETQPVEGCYDMIHLPLAALGKGARPVREESHLGMQAIIKYYKQALS